MLRDIQCKEKKTNFVQNVYFKNAFGFSFPTIYWKKQTNNQTTTTTKQNIKHNNKMTEWLLAHNQYATYIWINSIVIDLCANTKKQQWKKKNVQFDNV